MMPNAPKLPATPAPSVVLANPYAGRFQPLPAGRRGARCPVTGLCRASIYNYAARGDLRLVKIGGRVLLDVEHALAWIAAQPTLEVKRVLPERTARTQPETQQSASRAA